MTRQKAPRLPDAKSRPSQAGVPILINRCPYRLAPARGLTVRSGATAGAAPAPAPFPGNYKILTAQPGLLIVNGEVVLNGRQTRIGHKLDGPDLKRRVVVVN